MRRLKCLAHTLKPHSQDRGLKSRVTTAPRQQANRKCPYCSAETQTLIPPRQPPSEAPRAPAGGDARGHRGRPPPHPGPNLSIPMPRHAAARSSLPTAPSAFLDTTWPGPARVRLGPDEDPTPARVSLHYKPAEGGVAKTPEGLGADTSSNSRFSLSRARSVLRAISKPFGETAPLAAVSSARHPFPGGQYLSGKNSELLSGPHSPQFDTPVEPTHNLSRAPRRPPSRRQSLRTKMSGRVTGQPPPGPTPGPATHPASVPRSCAEIRGREHGSRAAPASEGAVRPRTHRQLGRRSGEARGG